jgi:uncharacterized protein
MRETIVSQNGLEGTFVRPDVGGPVPTVLIIAGSGPTDRDGNSHLGITAAPYKKLADGLAAVGIASLRFDKRMIGKSADPTLRESDVGFATFVDDAASWAAWLTSQRGVGSVFLAGHSEGALIASLAAKRVKPVGVVLMEGAGRRSGDILRFQLAAGPMPKGLLTDATNILAELEAGRKVETVNPALLALFRPSVQPFLISILSIDPAAEVRKLSMPVLIVGGGRDLQITQEDFEALAHAQPGAETLVLPTMNHVLKDVGEGRDVNLRSYSDPTLPLAKGLVEGIAAFVSSHEAR